VLNLLLEHGENGGRRVACLELGGEWMCYEIILVAPGPFVYFQWILVDGILHKGRQIWLISAQGKHDGSVLDCHRFSLRAPSVQLEGRSLKVGPIDNT